MSGKYLLWVGGKEVVGNGDPIPVENPATKKIFAECHSASTQDVEETIQIAHAAFKSGVWSRASRQFRADVLTKAADLLTAVLPTLVPLEVEQTGRAHREMQVQVPALVRWFRYFSALLRTEERPVLPTAGKLHNWLERIPLGVVVLITPFNHPLFIAMKKIVPALAAGNSVILKPSELTPLTSLLLGPVFKEAGVPDGVFNVLPGLGVTTGQALVGHPLVRKVDMTGGTASGRAIGAVLGGKLTRFTAELGGKSPLIIFEKANIDLAVNGVAFGAFMASGQTCIAATRIIVHNSIMAAVREKLVRKAASIASRMGSPANPKSSMGPVVSARQLANVERLVDGAVAGGADVLIGGSRMTGVSELDGTSFSEGYFYPPTILASGASCDITSTALWREEAFGPVIVLAGFDTDEEALGLANDSEFGLGAALWTDDLGQAFRVSERIESGIVWVNTHHRNDPSSPWGGATPASGVGSENGIDAYHAYTSIKSIIVNYATAEESMEDDWFREDAALVRYG
ncbi:NAD/NADP-dependent betaine aldehyde dehydrogenase [Escovopsis weberi]|uniref:aldehyde dehydrogenase (NAD(+)) n=1 Tax=Escovopsis weberi TaxID=150374 RepID=A0A0M8MW51_ESCWE|nr:NAD/NADP-dependent betaine aldehyde dehydrogenase [Escovopsis weberi]